MRKMEKQSRGNCFEGLIYPKEYIRNYEIIREKYKPGKNKNTPINEQVRDFA